MNDLHPEEGTYQSAGHGGKEIIIITGYQRNVIKGMFIKGF